MKTYAGDGSCGYYAVLHGRSKNNVEHMAGKGFNKATPADKKACPPLAVIVRELH